MSKLVFDLEYYTVGGANRRTIRYTAGSPLELMDSIFKCRHKARLSRIFVRYQGKFGRARQTPRQVLLETAVSRAWGACIKAPWSDPEQLEPWVVALWEKARRERPEGQAI
jgi:hypothetical protein